MTIDSTNLSNKNCSFLIRDILDEDKDKDELTNFDFRFKRSNSMNQLFGFRHHGHHYHLPSPHRNLRLSHANLLTTHFQFKPSSVRLPTFNNTLKRPFKHLSSPSSKIALTSARMSTFSLSSSPSSSSSNLSTDSRPMLLSSNTSSHCVATSATTATATTTTIYDKRKQKNGHPTPSSSPSSTSKSKRVRTIFTPDQLECLEKEFERQQYMVGLERSHLAASLNLSEAQVKVWFQNRRIKYRKCLPCTKSLICF